MTGKWWRASALASLLLLSVSSHAEADEMVYLYDPSVASEVDLQLYLSNGTIRSLTGQTYTRENQNILPGSAPEPFPTIAISERSFEQLGVSNAYVDGIYFVNHGQYYVPDKKALVLWVIRIPDASSRDASEFERDMTLSLWVDWNQDNAWRESERMTQANINLHEKFPTADDQVVVFYLTSFTVPDIAEMMANKGGNNKGDVLRMWARGVLAYDDPDHSPDGAQLFGEYEDYLLAYLFKPKNVGDDAGE